MECASYVACALGFSGSPPTVQRLQVNWKLENARRCVCESECLSLYVGFYSEPGLLANVSWDWHQSPATLKG